MNIEPPKSIEAEQGVLGAALLDPSIIDALAIQPLHFYESLHAAIFEAILKVRAAGLPPNVVTVGKEMSGLELPREVNLPAYLARLLSESLPSPLAPQMAALVVEFWRRRQIMTMAEDVMTAAARQDAGSLAESTMITAAQGLSALQMRIGSSSSGSLFGGSFLGDTEGRTTRSWLIKGVLTTKTFSLIIGAPGCGKSFLALDYALTSALAAIGRLPAEWFGRTIKPCGVAYLYAEGREDFEVRIEAFFQAMRMPRVAGPFYLIPSSVDLVSGTEGRDRLIADLRTASNVCEQRFGTGIQVVILDTVNRMLGGGDENSSSTMQAFVTACGVIKDQLGAAVIGVHHTPAGAEKARGHGSLHGATDAEIVVRPSSIERPNRWVVTRSKCGPNGASHEFRLRQQDVGLDESGSPETSCVVMPLGYNPSLEEAAAYDAALAAKVRNPVTTPDGRAILQANAYLAFQALDTAIERVGKLAPVDVRAPHGQKVVTFTNWIDEMTRLFPGEDKESKTFRARCAKARERAAATFLRRALIGMDGDYVWRTERKVMGVDKSEKQDDASDKPGAVSSKAPAMSPLEEMV